MKSEPKIWNLTSHPVTYNWGNASETPITIESDGLVWPSQPHIPAKPIGKMFLVSLNRDTEISGLPDNIKSGDVVIVSSIFLGETLKRLRSDIAIIVPDTGHTCQRDESGQVTNIFQFVKI